MAIPRPWTIIAVRNFFYWSTLVTRLISPSRRRLAAALILLVIASLAPAAAQRKPKPPKEPRDVAAFRLRVEQILSAAGAVKGHWAVLVADASSGKILYERNPDQYFAPASNTKLYTTALALASLGPDYRFRTTVETRGTLDAKGRLSGDLVLVGRGDPSLSNRVFPYEKEVQRDGPPEKILAALADQVVARGLRQLDGDVVADDSYYAHERFPSGWTVDDIVWGYGAAVSALTLHDNVVSLEVRPADQPGAPATFTLEPWAGYFTIENRVTTGPAGSERSLELVREPGSRTVELRGSLPTDARPATLTLAVEEPAEHAALLFTQLLEARGVRIYGKTLARHGPRTEPPGAARGDLPPPDAPPPTVLAEHLSVPLLEEIRLTNKISQNLHAELLLRAAAHEKASARTADDALKFAKEFFLSIGIPENEVLLSDGSGLSRRNILTPRATLILLQYIARQPWAAAYISTLPVAGEDGTLSDRMKNTSAAGRIHAKTGTLERVNALAGFATTLHNTEVVFAIYGNLHNLRGRDATAVVDSLCIVLVEELGRPAKPPRRK